MPSPSKTALAVNLEVSKRIREARKGQGISMQTLGPKIGVTWQQLQKYEVGTNRVSAGRLFLIAQELGVTVSSLIPEA